jgi:apolipoprotein N-acyltransferase
MHNNAKWSFFTAFLCGAIFFLTKLFWINNLLNFDFIAFWVIIGWLLLSLYCALYYGIFGWLLSSFCQYINKKPAKDGILKTALHNISIVIFAIIFWVGLEYIRATLFTGFPWALLGISQYKNLPIVQIADLFGVYGISALIVVMNAGLAFVILRFAAIYTKQKRPKVQLELIFALIFLLLSWQYGSKTIQQQRDSSAFDKIIVSTIQPDIPQIIKWDPLEVRKILDTLQNQTDLAAQSSPSLIIWPETVMPSPINYDLYMKDFVLSTVRTNGIPICLGSLEVKSETFNEKTKRYDYELSNSAFMVNTNGIQDIYRKNHLVMFGEYIPFENLIKPLKEISPLGFSCVPGKATKNFKLEKENIEFSTLICFEDIFAPLARRIAKNNASFIVNLTNDGWFDGTSLSIQHFSHSIFRAIETRKPLVRSTNSGVTAFVQSDGSTVILENDTGKYKFLGFLTHYINIAKQPEMTVYVKYGNMLFAIPAMCLTIIATIFFLFRKKYSKR